MFLRTKSRLVALRVELTHRSPEQKKDSPTALALINGTLRVGRREVGKHSAASSHESALLKTGRLFQFYLFLIVPDSLKSYYEA